MRIKSVLIVLGVVVASVLAGQFTGQSAAQAHTVTPRYYLALGDSLSQGFMPGVGNTNEGYVDDLYASLHARDHALQLIKLGCSGETTTTMRHGGICSYAGGSQLAAAEQFLRAHRGTVDYVTLDIGANDVDGCVSAAGIDAACIAKGLATIEVNLFAILAGLHHAGFSHTTVTAMTYYDPFLAAWLTGAAGQAAAVQSVAITHTLNAIERAEYAQFGIRVAHVAAAFRTDDFTDQVTLPVVGQVPVNVATICTLTYMCAVTNIHPNVTGYQLIAETFATAIAHRRRWN